jgi:hypothetical protein
MKEKSRNSQKKEKLRQLSPDTYPNRISKGSCLSRKEKIWKEERAWYAHGLIQ